MKLTYFNGRGRAEAARLLLAQAEISYEDKRVEFPEWPNLKPTMRFGQLPQLEIDGKTLYQSMAITRFLARKYNLAGKTNFEEAEADMIVDLINDTFDGKFVQAIKEGKDEERQKVLIAELLATDIPNFLTMIQKVLVDNGGKYLVGSDLTWADLVLVDVLETFVTGHALMPNYQNPEALKNFKILVDYKAKIENLPKIKAYIQKRPKTTF